MDLNNLNYDSWSVVAYQRSTVILTELVLGAALYKYSETSFFTPHVYSDMRYLPDLCVEQQIHQLNVSYRDPCSSTQDFSS